MKSSIKKWMLKASLLGFVLTIPAAAAELEQSEPFICSYKESQKSAETFTPTGFGVAGFVDQDLMGNLSWTYGWDSDRPDWFNNPTFVPMVWGGPMDAEETHLCGRKYGNTWRPGCANRTVADCDSPGGDIDANRRAFAQQIASRIDRQAACGRTWLIFNEPDLEGPLHGCADSSDLDPTEAGKLYDVLVEEIKKVDEKATFYCCGTIMNDHAENWLTDFFAASTQQVDGLHMHNYAWEVETDKDPWLSADLVIDKMINFRNFINDLDDPEVDFETLPILVTETSNFQWPANRELYHYTFMEITAGWINGCGKEHYGYSGVAWYASDSSRSGPCEGQAGCDFTTRTIADFAGGPVESITAYKKHFNYDLSADEPALWKNSGQPLSSVDHYREPGGPCRYPEGHDDAGDLRTDCDFSTRTLFEDAEGNLHESITTLGHSYTFRFDSTGPTLIDSQPLIDYSHYADGPCKGAITSCDFDSRSVYWHNGNLIDAVTRGATAYSFVYVGGVGSPQVVGPVDLATTEPFSRSDGPCNGTDTCQFETRTLFWSNGDLIDSITANGKYFNYLYPNGQGPVQILHDEGDELLDITRYSHGELHTSLYDKFNDNRIWTPLGNTWNYYEWGAVPYTSSPPPLAE